ncbi:2-C-methyl-D-erythritol 4-phosphate cytidylyltransferase [Litorisediminicola beolgyonensis]|uniref:2-C-methyl-D-erythritol 4-phosphate cytidylyltransferase n=1 Tax=Litorisediminicola beolgyonensis TaxID=1173614 RepID=A0ABW3ZK99_9RHOB
MTSAVLIVAAGQGTRAGGPVAKQWQEVAGKPVARWTLERFAPRPTVLVIRPEDEPRALAVSDGLDVRLVQGGATRAASVRAGLEALAEAQPDTVLIHDVARPCVPERVIAAVEAALARTAGAAPALAVTDALWTGADGLVTGTRDRAGLFRAQTPQGFRFDAILAAHRSHDGDAADDVAVARAAGLAVAIVPGAEDNLKITAPEDFARAAQILAREKE